MCVYLVDCFAHPRLWEAKLLAVAKLVHEFCVVWFFSVLLHLHACVGCSACGPVMLSSAIVCSCICALKSPTSSRSVEFGALLTSSVT